MPHPVPTIRSPTTLFRSQTGPVRKGRVYRGDVIAPKQGRLVRLVLSRLNLLLRRVIRESGNRLSNRGEIGSPSQNGNT